MKQIPFQNTYTSLPGKLFRHTQPTPVKKPSLISINNDLSRNLGIDLEWLQSANGIETLAGNHIAKGSEPISSAYAGHQFGVYNPQLGDGRAILLGEVLSIKGERFDLQLKGSGRTIYSRGGDGRSALGPVLREYLLCEAMHILSIPTTRALAAVTTGEDVIRDRILPGAILTRVAKSHIRIGTFQYAAATEDIKTLSALTDYTLNRHYADTKSEIPALSLLKCAVKAQAELVSQWQLVGFIHGVMNTDNSLISGETIDYGPCAFIDHYHPDTVFSSIDHGGRYSYKNQPAIAHWNLTMLAQALLPLIHNKTETAVEMAQEVINSFPKYFSNHHNAGLARKLGISKLQDTDGDLINSLFETMSNAKLDFTLTFRYLSDITDLKSSQEKIDIPENIEMELGNWLPRWLERLELEKIEISERQKSMYEVNPVFIPRNHLVEKAIKSAIEDGDFSEFHLLSKVLSSPFSYNSKYERYGIPPRSDQVVKQTFCGT
tara:strand:+ start:364 stop:1836 length:1473 start_codon:yes stop_codon:yes gene_type:complete